jgi:predicted CoA-binding protein
MAELKSTDEVRRVLETAKTVAVLGAHPDPSKPSNEVPAYLRSKGYRVLPVNPVHAGKELFGEKVRARLDEIEEPVDVVDLFRRADALPAHVDEILSMKPLPKVVWFQLGIRNDEVAGRLVEAGIDVVQDRCMLADHRRLF